MRIQILTTVVCSLTASSICGIAATPSEAQKHEIIQNYQNRSLLFEENRGQAVKGVGYVARGLDRGIAIRPTGVDIYMPTGEKLAPHQVSINFERANGGAKGEAVEPTANVSGFIQGELVVTGLVNYRRVRYDNVWPGTDVVYYGTGHDLEYDIVLHPGADPGKVKLLFSGIQSLDTNAAGELVIKAAGQEIVQRTPHIYQQIGDRKVDVAGRYHIGRDRRVSFEIAKYDHTQTLVIDPTLIYNNRNVANTLYFATSVAVDNSGFAYITGETYSMGTSNFLNFFLVKLDTLGNILGGPFYIAATGGNTLGNAVTLDNAGNIYVAGQTYGTGVTNGCSGCGFQNTLANAPNAALDAFVIVFASTFPVGPSSSNPITYATYLGGQGDDRATGIAVASPSAVYVTGSTTSSDFPKTQGPSSLSGTSDAFLVKVDTTKTGSSSKVWAEYVGGSGNDSGNGLAIDGSGNVYIAGSTTSPSSGFSPYPGGSGLGFNPSKTTTTLDGFLDKIDPTGLNSLYFTYFSNGQTSSVAVNGTTAYLAGFTPGSLGNITASAAQPTYGGGTYDAFLFRVDTSQTGSASLIYSTYLGGTGYDVGLGVAANNGTAYVTGWTNGNFPVKNAIQPTYGGGPNDALYAVVNTNGSGAASLLSATYIGGLGDDRATGMTLGLGSIAYITGSIYDAGTVTAMKILNNKITIHDFDTNGVPDMVWMNNNSRQVNVNYFGGPSGGSLIGFNILYPAGSTNGWREGAIADFNGDGLSDMVWQNVTTGQVNVNYFGPGGASIIGFNVLYPAGSTTGWHIVGVGDFNGDGVPDLVWQNDNTGQVNVNYFGGSGGASITGFNVLYPAGSTSGWRAGAVADFNGDGVPDIVWQNISTGQVNVNYFGGGGGASMTGFNVLYGAGTTTGWHIIGALDLDNNGTPDLLWQNDSSGQVNVNYFGGAGGASLIGFNLLYPAGSTNGWTASN